jgi:hypothetical protein
MALTGQARMMAEIERSVSNRFALVGLEDTWANRIAFYEGMLLAWRSEPITDTSHLSYNRVLQRLIDEAKIYRDATAELLGT